MRPRRRWLVLATALAAVGAHLDLSRTTLRDAMETSRGAMTTLGTAALARRPALCCDRRMPTAVPDLAAWDLLAEADCLAIARGLAIPGFTFDRVARCAQGDAARWVASFRFRDGAEFALAPGGARTLGYNATRPPALDAAGQVSWDGSIDEFGMAPFAEHLGGVMAPLRQVTLAPLLIETSARHVDAALAGAPADADASTHARVVAALAADGLRLLTADEWEHACAAGTRTLWRWGDACPADHEPYGDVSFAELARPNAFGLAIARNPYDWEYIADPREMRGGDGGDAVCGGYGAVAAWLALASPYRWPMFDDDSFLEEGFVRRAVAIA